MRVQWTASCLFYECGGVQSRKTCAQSVTAVVARQLLLLCASFIVDCCHSDTRYAGGSTRIKTANGGRTVMLKGKRTEVTMENLCPLSSMNMVSMLPLSTASSALMWMRLRASYTGVGICCTSLSIDERACFSCGRIRCASSKLCLLMAFSMLHDCNIIFNRCQRTVFKVG